MAVAVPEGRPAGDAGPTADALVCLLCFGPAVYARMAEVCVRSLRRWGRFEGDLVVITDGCFRAKSLDVRVIEVGGHRDRLQVQLFKGTAASYVPTERYARIALMDIDMVAIEDVAPLFRADGDAVFGVDEYPFNSMLAPSCGGRLLQLDERACAFEKWGVNSGFLCTAADNFHPVMERWAQTIARQPQQARVNNDQPFFNNLVLRGEVRFQSLERGLIDMPPMYPWHGGEYHLQPNTRLLHFCGDWKDLCLRQMNAVADALDQGASCDDLDRLVHDLVHAPMPTRPAWRRAASRAARPLRRALQRLRA